MKQKRQKVAILISGHIRSYETCLEKINKIKEYFDADIFIHTWRYENVDKDCWHITEDFKIAEDIEYYLNSTLNPKVLLVEDQKEIRKKFLKKLFISKKNIDTIPGFYFQYYGVIEAYNIFKKYKSKKKINYDTLIRYRFDIIPQDIDNLILDIKESHESSYSYVSEHNWAQILNIYFDGIFISSDLIYSLKIELLKENLKNKKYQNNLIFFPEMLYSYTVRKVTKRIKIINSKIGICRSNGKLIPTFSKSNNKFKTNLNSSLKVLIFLLKRFFKFKKKQYKF